eukprot:gene19160-928_t
MRRVVNKFAGCVPSGISACLASVHTSPFKSIEPSLYETGTVTDLIIKGDRAGVDPSADAFVDPYSERTLSFLEVQGYVAKVANGLRAQGLESGDVVMMHSPNIIDYVAVFHGTTSAGGVISTCNPLYTAEEVIKQVNASKAKFMVTIPMFKPVAEAAAAATGVKVFVLGEASWGGLLDGQSPVMDFEAPANDSVTALPFSSGTT